MHSFKGGCFQANLLAVSAPLPPLSLGGHLGALAGDLGCFPLDDEAYPPLCHWPTLTLVILRSYLVFRVCLDLVPLSWLAPKQCFTPRCPVNCYASTHFRENQLALGSSGISPLTTTHLLILQHQSVQISTQFHPSFILVMDRSPKFGSISSENCHMKTCFCYGFGGFP